MTNVKRLLALLGTSALLSVFTPSLAIASNPSYGSLCKKLNAQQTYQYITYVCLRVKGKLVWTGKQEGSTSRVSTIAPQPTGFLDLFEKRRGISSGALSKAREVFQSSTETVPQIQIFTGPTTKTFETNAVRNIGTVYKLLGANQGIKAINVFYLNSQDETWARTKVQSMMGEIEYQKGQDFQGGPLVNCGEGIDCNRSTAWTTPDGTAYLIVGVPNNPDDSEKNFGVSDTEYYHSVDNAIYLFQNSLIPSGTPSIYPLNQPPYWLHLGGELLSACLAGSNLDSDLFYKCVRGRELSFSHGFPNPTLAQINQYLDLSNVGGLWRDSHYAQMNEALPIGTYLMEMFIAFKGPAALTDFDKLMSKGMSFADSFQSEFGISWQDAEPQIAKTIWDRYLLNY